jgi:hypothetical protein
VATADTVSMERTSRDSLQEALIFRMLDSDALDKVLGLIDDGACTPVWFACKAFNARRPAGKFTTSVNAMFASPAMLDWAIEIGLLPLTVLKALPDFVTALLAQSGVGPDAHKKAMERLTTHAGTIVGFLAVPDTDVRCYALRALCNVEQQTLTANVSAIVGMLTVGNPYVRYTALQTLCNVKEAVAFTVHAGTIKSLVINPYQDVIGFSYWADLVRKCDESALVRNEAQFPLSYQSELMFRW